MIFYKDIDKDIEEKFDTSNYKEDHQGVKQRANKKVIGMMKDETAGQEIAEFVGLRAKLYAYKVDDREEKRCKGVKRSVVKNNISFDDYKKCLFEGQQVMRKMNVIRSHKHQIYTETVNKVALSRDDDKREIESDGINTHAYGFKNMDELIYDHDVNGFIKRYHEGVDHYDRIAAQIPIKKKKSSKLFQKFIRREHSIFRYNL